MVITEFDLGRRLVRLFARLLRKADLGVAMLRSAVGEKAEAVMAIPVLHSPCLAVHAITPCITDRRGDSIASPAIDFNRSHDGNARLRTPS